MKDRQVLRTPQERKALSRLRQLLNEPGMLRASLVRCRCKKIVEPVILDALPASTIGNHLLTLSAWLHYGVGMTLSSVLLLFNWHHHFQMSSGGLIQMWYRLPEILYP